MEMTKIFDVNYTRQLPGKPREFSHKYEEKWVYKEKLHCPHCMANYVWMRDDGGDYYAGEQYMCGDCGCCWACHGFYEATDEQDAQRLTRLKGA